MSHDSIKKELKQIVFKAACSLTHIYTVKIATTNEPSEEMKSETYGKYCAAVLSQVRATITDSTTLARFEKYLQNPRQCGYPHEVDAEGTLLSAGAIFAAYYQAVVGSPALAEDCLELDLKQNKKLRSELETATNATASILAFRDCMTPVGIGIAVLCGIIFMVVLILSTA